MKKKESKFIREMKLKTPPVMDYYVPFSTEKDKDRLINRVKRIVRGSMEYKDCIKFLKDHVGLDHCIFFKEITSNKAGGKHISIEMHHEPFTLHDIVSVVLEKYIESGLDIDDLLIADEVLELHYDNQVGLVPLSKTAHQMIHNSNKLMIPINMCYGNYSKFLEDYEPWIPDTLYDKLERKIKDTKALTKDSFDALVKEFTYLNVNGFEDAEKLEIESDAKDVELSAA